MSFLAAIPIVGKIVETLANMGNAYMEKKVVKAKGAIEIEKAKVEGKIKYAQTIAESDSKYDQTALEGMAHSFKDELITIVWMAILVGAFLPWTQPYIKNGFEFLNTSTPWWFEYTLLGIVAASFGLKGWKVWKKNGA